MPPTERVERRNPIPLGEPAPEEISIEIEDLALQEEEDFLFDDEEAGVEGEHFDNLAEQIDDGELDQLGSELAEAYKADLDSRSDWDEIITKGIELLGFHYEEMEEPFPGASNVSHPLLAQAVVKYQARAYKELFPAKGPVRTKLMGTQTNERLQQASRVRDYMNYQTTVEMTEYGPELDRLLFHQALQGSVFKKTYFDPTLGRPTSRMVKADDFVIDYYASDLETAERFSHKQRYSDNDLIRARINGLFREVEMTAPASLVDTDAREAEDEIHGIRQPSNASSRTELVGDVYDIIEMHINMDLLGYEHEEGLKLPYIVHFDLDSGTILSIRRNWEQDDDTYGKISYFTHYCFIPGLGFYGYGYIHIVGGLARTATAALRELLDAGSFANLPAGFKAHGLRVLAPDQPLSPGEWRDVNAPAGDLQKSLHPLPYKEPSLTLFKLLEFVEQAGKEFADQTDQVLADSTNYGPVGTTMALLEQSASLYSAVHKRTHAAQCLDLKILARINKETLPDQYPYEVSGRQNTVMSEDFNLSSIDVIPVSDPNMPTEAHRIAKINAIKQIAITNPQGYNMEAIDLDLFTAMGVDQPERYLAQQQEPFTGDPVTENSVAMQGKPIKSDLPQNHDAHIMVHAATLQNPAYSQIPGFMPMMTSHVQQHLAQKYMLDILSLIGDDELTQAVLTAAQQGQPLPPEVSQIVAVRAAEVADKLTGVDQVKADILSGADADPAVELQKRELDLRQLETMMDHFIKRNQLALDEAKLMIDDSNTDLDRDAKIKVANIQAAATKSVRAQRSSSN